MNFEEQIPWGNLVNAKSVRIFTHNCEIVIFGKKINTDTLYLCSINKIVKIWKSWLSDLVLILYKWKF